jgi:hypothetical protein
MNITTVRDDLLQAIVEAARSGDLSHVVHYLAEDVQFSVSIAVRSPTKMEIHGRQSLIAHLGSLDGKESSKTDEPVEVFVGGERIVATRNATVAIGADMALGNECTLVCDLRYGLIRRLVVHHVLSHAVGLPSTTSAPVRGSNRKAAAVSVVNTVHA